MRRTGAASFGARILKKSATPLEVLVVGSASLDTLHIGGQTFRMAGGAGLYTALAANCAGARAALFAPRPAPVPEALQPVADSVEWIGPDVSSEEIPRLEIAHHGAGKATLLGASWGAVASLNPEALPADRLRASIVHIAALPDADHQMRFVQACRRRGAARVSAGTYARLIANERGRVHALFEAVDLFFMSENEANLLFGSVDAARTRADRTLFVTLAERGALVIRGDQAAHVPGRPASEVDPTGAGDTFCGAVLAGLARGEDATTASRAAIVLAAEMIGAIGPSMLLERAPRRRPAR